MSGYVSWIFLPCLFGSVNTEHDFALLLIPPIVVYSVSDRFKVHMVIIYSIYALVVYFRTFVLHISVLHGML